MLFPSGQPLILSIPFTFRMKVPRLRVWIHSGFSAFQGQPVLPGDTVTREKPAVTVLYPLLALDRLSYDGTNGMVYYRYLLSQGLSLHLG